MMKGMRRFVRKINNIFVLILLFIVYYPTIGLCFVIYKLSKTKSQDQNTYWIDMSKKPFDKKYFKSSY